MANMEGINSNDVLLHDLSAPQSAIIPPPPPREKNKRPQLSCNPCRARKVKIADICQYDLSESERQPILQAEALKEKDKTITALREEIASLRGETIRTDYDDHGAKSQKIRLPPHSPRKHHFQGHEHERYFFDESGMTNVADDFEHLSFDRRPSTFHHPVQFEPDIFSIRSLNSYPFPTLWTAKDDTSSLIRLLPQEQDLFFYLETFQRRSLLFSFPHVPDQIAEPDIRKFLENLEHNAALYPDLLALLFATLALGLQDGVYDKCGQKWSAGAVENESKKGEVFIAAAMQCLRLAAFTNRPTLLVVQTLVMIAPYLTNSGKFLDASALFGLTVRLAESIGLHRDASGLNLQISNKQLAARKSLWWWIIHMDQHYSVTLGRPLAISMTGDCPPPENLFPDQTWNNISTYMEHFSMLARQIISAPYLPNDKIDKYTDDVLILHQSLLPSMLFDITWLNRDRPLIGWPFDVQAAMLHAKVHNLLISLNRRRVDPVRRNSDGFGMNPLQLPPVTDITGVVRGRTRVLESCRALLNAFEFFHTRLRAGMICWTMGQMAFNASMLLTLSMLETGETQDLLPVQHAYSTFLEMNKLGVHKLAGAAVERLGRLMKEFRTDDSANETVMGHGSMMLLEDPGNHKPAPDSSGYATTTSSSPDLKATASSSHCAKPSNRRRQARRSTTTRDVGVTKTRRNSLNKSQRPLADRRFSDSVAPRPAQRRRINRSTPNLSLLTTLSDPRLFSATSTPAVKSETIFTPSVSTFDDLAHSAFSSPHQQASQDVHSVLDDVTNPQNHNYSPQHPQLQRQQQSFHAQLQQQMQQNQHASPQPDQTMRLSSHPTQQLPSASQSASADQHQFDFSNNSTPYSSDFFDGNLHPVVGTQGFEENHIDFEHQPFSTQPFTMPPEHQGFVASQS
ncbi:uncharacterized protein KY384_001498 [Bacidia gigantensis]|uniref:uncharacterized protein n=1 Tax=Bacidia gigantensis TaxID=2732470 RepID=UPI001D048990|nr:uncharacterized protein KY384_001498 [Bacidia gigantensis]KAG8533757.1 hypothetical protein KY384_001498 [Bacidia gigantensis]